MIEILDSPSFVETETADKYCFNSQYRAGAFCIDVTKYIILLKTIQWLPIWQCNDLSCYLCSGCLPHPDLSIYIDARITDYRISSEMYDQKLHHRTGPVLANLFVLISIAEQRTDPIIVIIHRETFFFSFDHIKTKLNDR